MKFLFSLLWCLSAVYHFYKGDSMGGWACLLMSELVYISNTLTEKL